MKIKLLGLGNIVISDDAVGLAVAKSVEEVCQNPDVTIATSSAGGFRLLDELVGYDQVIIVDAIISDRGTPGDYYWLELEELRSPVRSRSNHNLHLAEAIELGTQLGMEMPSEVKVLAIEVEDCFTLHIGMTDKVSSVVKQVAGSILEQIHKALGSDNTVPCVDASAENIAPY
jgi:hydrogenase maturation protease